AAGEVAAADPAAQVSATVSAMIDQQLVSYEGVRLVRQGWAVTLLEADSKKAAFKELKSFTAFEVQHWCRRGIYGLAILMRNGVMCCDVDGDEGLEFAKCQGWLDTPMQ